MLRWRVSSPPVTRLLVGVAGVAFLAPLAGCTGSTPPKPPNIETTYIDRATTVEIGNPLYTPKPLATIQVSAQTADPVIVPNATVSIVERQDVPSQVDGVVLAIATEIKPGEVVKPELVYEHPVTKVKYRKLEEGNPVNADQLVVLLDDEKYRSKYDNLIKIVPSTLQMRAFADQFVEITKKLVSIEDQLKRTTTGGTSELQYQQTMAQHVRGLIDQVEKVVNALRAQSEFDEAKVMMKFHQVRSSVPGIIRHIHKRPGEAVKALDSILEIENPGKVKVEGLVAMENLAKVEAARVSENGLYDKAGKIIVFIEPDKQVTQDQTLPAHTRAITAVAVGRNLKNKKQPFFILTGSEDGSVCVQDRTRELVKTLPHPVAVRALTCSPTAAAANLCLTGADDGKVRVWDLNALDGTPVARDLKGRHRGAVSAVAFSLDGKYAASADDQSIYLWDAVSGDLKYELPAQHRGQVTMLQFTPQAKLLSAGRDNTLLCWSLGEKGARLELSASLEQRSGQVPVLGASADGREVIFDRSAKSLRLMALPERRELGSLESSETTSFANFAYFSPDAQFILAGTSSPDRVQLWRAPTVGVRGTTTRQYICKTVSGVPYSVRCAAFAPDGSFAVAGTAEGDALVLELPSKDEFDPRHQLKAVVTLIDSTEIVNPSGKQSRLRAELLNMEQRLVSGDVVTIVAVPAAK